ncbi:MAG: hypothetical protein WBN23_08665, partial [Woeseia sp.]
IELRDTVRCSYEPQKLSFGCFQRSIRHHIEQADVQFADVLLRGAFAAEQYLSFVRQTLITWQIIVRDKRHSRRSAQSTAIRN